MEKEAHRGWPVRLTTQLSLVLEKKFPPKKLNLLSSKTIPQHQQPPKGLIFSSSPQTTAHKPTQLEEEEKELVKA